MPSFELDALHIFELQCPELRAPLDPSPHGSPPIADKQKFCPLKVVHFSKTTMRSREIVSLTGPHQVQPEITTVFS